MKCDIYLSFDGNCEEALNFYRDILDGEVVMMMRYKDGPPEFSQPGIEDKVMHTTLKLGDNGELKMSDSFHEPLNKGNNFHVSIDAEDPQQGHAIFSGLSEGGHVTMPYNDVFWGGKFGSCIDKFGVQWMVSAPSQ